MIKQPTSTHEQYAKVEWDEASQPISAQFGDVYFSKENGLEETRYVFLHNNDLESRWKTLEPDSDFVIGETGFGSGLNFLAAWDLWRKAAPSDARLHFVSVEKYPLKISDLTRALELWPTLSELSAQLLEHYPSFLNEGFHRLSFDQGKVHLTLIIDDAAEGYSQLLISPHPYFAACGLKVNAWFLDGFAPSKNPQMWSDQLFERIAQLSTLGTTLATFSAAAPVKKVLSNHQFIFEKVKGFGKKREMLKARFLPDNRALDPNQFRFLGSFSPYPVPWPVDLPYKKNREKTALVIGGGLAGCHTARALADRGWRIKLIEKSADLAHAGSGNPQGAVYAKLSPLAEAQAAFNLSAFQFALNTYRPLWKKLGAEFGEACGLLQLAYDEQETKLQELLQQKFHSSEKFVRFVNSTTASQLAGTQVNFSGIYFPQSGWINPKSLCHYLVDHPNINVITHQTVEALEFDGTDWLALSKKRILATSSIAIVCNASDALQFDQLNHLPLKPIRGQVTYFEETTLTPRVKTVVSADGYISPATNGHFCVGATFNLRDPFTDLRTEDHEVNLKNILTVMPEFSPSIEALDLNKTLGRVGFRSSLPDYLPAVGPAPNLVQFIETFAPLRKNARAGIVSAGHFLPNLYVNVAHGSRGLAYTPLCAQLLASQICGEPLPLSYDLAASLHPARFIIRDLTRSKR